MAGDVAVAVIGELDTFGGNGETGGEIGGETGGEIVSFVTADSPICFFNSASICSKIFNSFFEFIVSNELKNRTNNFLANSFNSSIDISLFFSISPARAYNFSADWRMLFESAFSLLIVFFFAINVLVPYPPNFLVSVFSSVCLRTSRCAAISPPSINSL